MALAGANQTVGAAAASMATCSSPPGIALTYYVSTLRTVDGCGDVIIPYRDRLSDTRDRHMIPWIFLEKEYKFESGVNCLQLALLLRVSEGFHSPRRFAKGRLQQAQVLRDCSFPKLGTDLLNYTHFSNSTSTTNKWNDNHQKERNFERVIPLKTPHGGVHLAMGGYTIPGGPALDLAIRLTRATGDME